MAEFLLDNKPDTINCDFNCHFYESINENKLNFIQLFIKDDISFERITSLKSIKVDKEIMIYLKDFVDKRQSKIKIFQMLPNVLKNIISLYTFDIDEYTDEDFDEIDNTMITELKLQLTNSLHVKELFIYDIKAYSKIKNMLLSDGKALMYAYKNKARGLVDYYVRKITGKALWERKDVIYTVAVQENEKDIITAFKAIGAKLL